MTFLGWMTLAGGLLLFMSLASAYVQRLPVSTSSFYMALGLGLGPAGVGLLHLDIAAPLPWFERLTEVAVVLSLFTGGLKLRLSPRHPAWRAAYRLAGPVMIASIAGVALFAHLALGLDLATSLLLGAALAPTDPVLASAVTVNDAADQDRMRYGLSGEAGLNDGMAFPFVVFALEWSKHEGGGGWVISWFLSRLLWAVPAGLVLGFCMGLLLGRFAIRLRHVQRDATAPSDFLALALIALSYVAAEAIHAWGFLAVFAAGVGLRHAEMRVVRTSPHPDHADADRHPPAEHVVAASVSAESLKEPTVAAGSLVAETLSFGQTAERIMEVLLVGLVGVGLAQHWDPRGVAVALVLFFGVRPLATLALLVKTPTTGHQRLLMGWLGLRGIGSLYYLAHAIDHGVSGAMARDAASITLTVVAISVVVHGSSATPLVNAYERALARRRA